MNKTWEYYQTDEDLINKISNEHDIDSMLATILINRGITEDEKIKVFLNPTRNDFYNPFLLPDMQKCVERILTAINKKEKILIYGDYDVDGITSITTLKKFLDELGLDVSYYIPKRLEEGYGLNKSAIAKIKEKGYNLVITVDCGISAIEEIQYANSLGIETIITDHHEPLEELPNALAVINPKRKDSNYPFKSLAGVGVVFKLIQALSINLNLDEKEYLKYLDLVCIGTISDIVPLIDENRVISKLGLKLIQVTKNIGLKTLIESMGYKKIDSNTVSYGIGPRINACGRMGYESEALELFLTQDIEIAKQITAKLNSYNVKRQDIEKRIYKEVREKLKNEDVKNLKAIIMGSSNWHHGVIGIVSSKITEEYYKPTILVCFEDNIGKGSGRSIPGFDLHDALCKTSKYLDKYGGHEMAIGLTLSKENFDKFKQEFIQLEELENINNIHPIIKIDKQISLKELSIPKVANLKKLEPFGEANKTPLFSFKNLKIEAIRAITEGKHLKLTLKEDNILIDAIAFNLGELSLEYRIGEKIDIVGTLEINTYNLNEKLQINIRDIRKSY